MTLSRARAARTLRSLARAASACALAATAAATSLAAPLVARAQGVLVAPQGVFMDDRARSTSIELYNPGTEPADITIGTLFGYPVTDSSGHTQLAVPTGDDTTGRSAAAWIEAFPRRLTLQPQQRQTVRLLARPPQGLRDGEYWARLTISARGGRVPVAGVSDTAAIQVGLTLEVRTIIAALYRKGPVSSGITLTAVRGVAAGDSLEVWSHLERQGNAAYIGTVRATLENAAGATVATLARPVAVYYALTPMFSMPLAGVPAGRYTLRVEAVTDRDDVPRAALLAVPTARASAAVVIPPR